MENLKVVKIERDKYTLKNIKTKAEYNFSITFFGLKQDVAVGDVIAIHKELLDPTYVEYSTQYYFGPLNEVYGRKVTSKDDIDFIAIKTKNDIIKLKRFFG